MFRKPIVPSSDPPPLAPEAQHEADRPGDPRSGRVLAGHSGIAPELKPLCDGKQVPHGCDHE